MILKKTIPGLLVIFPVLFCAHLACAQHPYLEYSGGRVWLKNIQPEVLYTFARYYNTDEAWRTVFPVTTGDSTSLTIDGHYEVLANTVSFTPRFDFVSNLSYTAKFFLDELAGNLNEIYLPKSPDHTLVLKFSVASQDTSVPTVTAIYPTADTLPENLLKFHIVFSASMTRGEVYKRVKLLNSSNREVEKAFLVVDQELWDSDMKAVTLLLDPGRIKRGLKANLEMGAPLKQSLSYTLVIEGGWPNQFGTKTAETTRKHFTCIAADRKKPSLENWTLHAPRSPGSPLTIDMHESFDADLLGDAIRIMNSRGQSVAGNITLLQKESQVAFEPATPWSNDTYTILFNPLLEDLAGNNLKRLFDEDLTELKPSQAPVKNSMTLTLSLQGN